MLRSMDDLHSPSACPFSKAGSSPEAAIMVDQRFEAHVARNGALITGAHQFQSCMTDSGSHASISTVLFGEPKVSFGPSGKTRLQICEPSRSSDAHPADFPRPFQMRPVRSLATVHIS